jgi:hypothetical protein
MTFAQALVGSGVVPTETPDYTALSREYGKSAATATNDDELENPEMLTCFLDFLFRDSLSSDHGIVVHTVSRSQRLAKLTAGVLIDD